MSRCSKLCNEIKTKIDNISGLDDDYIYDNLLFLKKTTDFIVDTIILQYSEEDELNGTCFKKYEEEK